MSLDRALSRIRQTIEEVEAAAGLGDVSGVRKVSGGEDFYRIRVGSYRIGLAVEGDHVTFVRCLHRREMYRYFP
jgi:mRNA interferase RelE/StbE